MQLVLIRIGGCALGCIDNGTFLVPGYERIQVIVMFDSITMPVPANLFSALRAVTYLSSANNGDVTGGLPQALLSPFGGAVLISCEAPSATTSA